MALITRLARLLRADLHAVLDRLEEPAALLRQALRDMEEELAADARRCAGLRHQHEQHATREAALADTVRDTDLQLDVCFAAQQDDLARVLIKRKLEAERLRALVGERRAAARDTLAAIETRIAENRARLEGLRQQADALVDEPPTAGAGAVPYPAVGREDVEVAFLREQQRRARS